jgi:hypothetical protein
MLTLFQPSRGFGTARGATATMRVWMRRGDLRVCEPSLGSVVAQPRFFSTRGSAVSSTMLSAAVDSKQVQEFCLLCGELVGGEVAGLMKRRETFQAFEGIDLTGCRRR